MPALPDKNAPPVDPPSLSERVASLLAELESFGSRKQRAEMITRYGIHTAQAWGTPMATMQKIARRLGPDHTLAAALWETGWYEARTLAALIEEASQVTPSQMDRWAADFDNWALCDTVCFKLFDSTPHALEKVTGWAPREEEFIRRAAFALLASVALHNKRLPDRDFAPCFALIESAATDDRNFVMKAVNWALRAVGERSPSLHTTATALSQRLAESKDKTSRWIGKDALKQLHSPATLRRLGRRSDS